MFHLFAQSLSVDSDSLAVLGLILMIYALVFLFYLLPSLIILWNMYKKAGEPGWAAIIPVYNYIVFAKIGQRPMWAGIAAGVLSIVSAAIPFGGIVLLILALWLLAGFYKRYNQGIGFWILFIFFPIIAVFFIKKIAYIGAGDAQVVPASAGGATTMSPQPVQQAAPEVAPPQQGAESTVLAPATPVTQVVAPTQQQSTGNLIVPPAAPSQQTVTQSPQQPEVVQLSQSDVTPPSNPQNN